MHVPHLCLQVFHLCIPLRNQSLQLHHLSRCSRRCPQCTPKLNYHQSGGQQVPGVAALAPKEAHAIVKNH
jgi:hypothetical protein